MTSSGDRHLRPEPSGRLKSLHASPRDVGISIDRESAGTFAGQVVVAMLVNLLARQFGVVDRIVLDIPHAHPDFRAFPSMVNSRATLREQLIEFGRAVAGEEMRVEGGAVDPDLAVQIQIGPGLAPTPTEGLSLVVFGDGWEAFCSSIESSPERSARSLVPFGPMLAACLAAGRAFRHLWGADADGTSSADLWSFMPAAWSLERAPELQNVELPDTHVIGLGAVGAAFCFALACAPDLRGNLVGLDPQDTDVTSRNRLLSALYVDVRASKAKLADRLFQSHSIEFFPNSLPWPAYALDPKRNAPAAVKAEEDNFRYRWVVSCVDDNIHRQNIANYLPKHLLGGSTKGLVAQATYYSILGPCECLTCNHPVIGFNADALIQELRDMTPEGRSAVYDQRGLSQHDRAAIDEYLEDPECDVVGAAELRRMGVEGAAEWSVGFVSAAAGVMLAAYYLRCVMEGAIAVVGAAAERRLIFLGAQELIRSGAVRKADCELCSSQATKEHFAALWSGA